MSNNAATTQAITTLQNDAYRASRDGLLNETYLPGEYYGYYRQDRPVTVESVVAVFPTFNNFFKLYPIAVGSSNYTGAFYLSLWRRTIGRHTLSITGVTKASPGVVTVSEAHNYSTGDRVLLNDIFGMTELNGKYATITNLTTTTFSIGIDTSNYATAIGGVVTDEKSISGWFGEFIGSFQFVLGALTGATNTPVKATERFADTIASFGNFNDASVRQIWSPASASGDTPGYLLVDPMGAPYVMLEPDVGGGTGTAVTNLNALITTL